jgi:transcription termination/antitermination protein NusG
MYWYILFVRTGREQQVECFLKESLNTDELTPFIPMHEMLFKTTGIVKKEVKPLFPSYVFIESKVSEKKFMEKISVLLRSSSDILRLLRYSESEIAMRESEKQMLLSLCNENYYIEASSGVIEGDKVKIIHGPLKGWESMVRKIDRHKKLAWIDLEFIGEVRLICVSLEIIQKYKIK